MLQILVRELVGETDVVLLSTTRKTEVGVKTWGRDWSNWPTLEEGPEPPPEEPGVYVWEGTVPEEPQEGEEQLWRWHGAWREIIPGWKLPAPEHALGVLADWIAIYEAEQQHVIMLHERGSWTEIEIGFWNKITKEEGEQIAKALQACTIPGKLDVILTSTAEGVSVQVAPKGLYKHDCLLT